MANLRILVPEATVNYVICPSFETEGDAAGSLTRGFWDSFTTISITKDYARFGSRSFLMTTGASAANNFSFYQTGLLAGINEPITASVYLRGNASARIRLLFGGPGGKEFSTQYELLTLDRWKRFEITGQSNGNAVTRLYIESSDNRAGLFVYIDGVQLERKPYATTYCDGDQPGCRWNGQSYDHVTQDGSTSERSAYTREGGRWVDLAGPCRKDQDLYVTVLGGLGMPPIANNIQPWAESPGSYFQNNKILDRTVTFSFFAKHKDLRPKRERRMSALHLLRQQLIDLIKPDRTQGSQDFLFEYDDGDYPLYLAMRYQAGLEGEWDIRNTWINSFPVRFLAVDPTLREDNQNVKALDFLETFNTTAAAQKGSWGRINGIWSALASPGQLNEAVRCWAIGHDGKIYAGGNFTNNGLTRIAYWDGIQWNAMGTGCNGAVNAIAIGQDGQVYATGDFTLAGGVANTVRIARWDATGGSGWKAMSTGLTGGGGFALCVPSNGQIYVGGAFTVAGGVTVNRIARWDGTQFRTCGSPTGLSATVRALVKSPDGATIYVGGGGGMISLATVCSLDTTTNLFSNNMAQGNLDVYALTVGPDGTVYAGGDTSPYIEYFTGMPGGSGEGGWHSMGEAANGKVLSLATGVDGSIYAGGEFTEIGGVAAKWVAKWVGGVWVPLDIMISAASGVSPSGVYGIIQNNNGDLYVGSYVTPTVAATLVPGVTLVENTGSQAVSPRIFLSQSFTLRYLENLTTGKRVYFFLDVHKGPTVNAMEEITIDFEKSTIKSNTRGDMFYSVLPGSDFKAFQLLPGENKILAFMTNDNNAVMQIQYTPAHWSMDAVKTPEPL